MHKLVLVYFVNLYMFRAYLGPSSGGTTVCIQQLALTVVIKEISYQVGIKCAHIQNYNNLFHLYFFSFAVWIIKTSHHPLA